MAHIDIDNVNHEIHFYSGEMLYGEFLYDRKYLEIYRGLLVPGGYIAFKTDNAALFEFSKKEFTEMNFELRCVTDDLHGSEWREWILKNDAETEYEKMWNARGSKIHRLEAVPKISEN